MQLNPLPVTATPASNRPLTFPPQPQTKTGQYEDGPTDRSMRSNPTCPILKPRPECPPSGTVQQGPHHCYGQKVTTLIDLEAQISSVSSRFCEQMTMKVHPLDKLLELEGTGGSAIPYLGDVEVNLQIPGI